MKTRAYDCDERKWRNDYIIMPDGSVWSTFNRNHVDVYADDINEIVEPVNWKLSRFTGHIDINKNEIYENHILKLASGSIGVVEFRDGSFIVDIKKESGEFEFYEWPNEYFLKYDYDDGFVPGALIIGNVFDNPELLEV